MNVIPYMHSMFIMNQNNFLRRCIHVSAVHNRTQAGRYRPKAKPQPLTYEMANPPHHIAARKAWNSWNTSNVLGGNRPSETAVEDMFIRNFMNGTWPSFILSEVIIKRQHNMIRISAIMALKVSVRTIYFLIGYSEELLSLWLHCPVKLELVVTASSKDVIYKVI
ncbi:mitochondrial ribosomal protein S24 [Nomia melanderi]|uniref:mitochondrial ribosomal protein S24 n=1 Tax=Nomia melanderi TaxID=2448451 RepID=UPI0013044EB9|nr:28S ribosomal protein S24, mitochondrial [Nomia melanderi]